MHSIESMQSIQESKDFKREDQTKELKKEWFNYSPSKRVQLTKQYPEIAEAILSLIEI